jgi:oligopeptide transport system permease protein
MINWDLPYDEIEFLPTDFEWAESKPSAETPSAFEKEGFPARLFRSKTTLVSALCILVITLAALIGPILSPYRYDQQLSGRNGLAPKIPLLEQIGIFDGSERVHGYQGAVTLNKYEKLPGGEAIYHIFGTDALGRDLFTRICVGTRISLFIAFASVLIDLVFGVTYGFVSGYVGGWLDIIMQRIIEIISGIPNLIVVTLLIIVLRPGLVSIIFALMLTGWIGMSRIARAQTLKIKEQEYILAVKTMGASHVTIIAREILPNTIGQLLAMSMLSVPSAIFMEAFLAFIGIGVPVPMASLGSIISESFKSLTSHPYMAIFPVVILAILMLSFNLFADGLRDIIDPKMKGR